MASIHDLTPAALAGFHAAPGTACPHYSSSPNGMAWLLGAWLAKGTRPEPASVRMSRGYSLRVDGAVYAMQGSGADWEAK